MPTPADQHPALHLAAVVLAVLGGLYLASLPDPLAAVSPAVPEVQPMARTERAPAPDRSRVEVAQGRYREAELDPVAQLEAIGYLAGSREAGDERSVNLHDPERAFQGLNLYTSGHAAEAVLMDMEGQTIHRWSRSFRETWPHWAGRPNENMTFWRRVHLLPDGHLLAIFEGLGLVRLDAESNLIWARPNSAHHDLEVLPDGRILVLTRRVEMAEELDVNRPTLVDYVSLLSPDGLELERTSLLNAYVNSPFGPHFRGRAAEGGDSFHTNTLHRIRADAGPFRAGQLLLSMRHLDTLALLDPDSRRIAWSQRGEWRLQHDPKILDNGNLLLFDNGPPQRAASQVIELDTATGQVVWRYRGDEESPFWSATCGTAERLPNGNTLITESDGGRALEVTPAGERVWEFHNPHRPEDRPELVATLFEVVRLPADLDLSWLPEPADDQAEPTP